jgi:hypothetical protein
MVSLNYLDLKFKELLPIIIQNIQNELVKAVFPEQNHNIFYEWFINNAEYDFMYIYEMCFKQYFLEHFTVETERILSYYSQNLFYAVLTYYDIVKDLPSIIDFMINMANKQFEHIDPSQLFMEH